MSLKTKIIMNDANQSTETKTITRKLYNFINTVSLNRRNVNCTLKPNGKDMYHWLNNK